MRLVVDVSDDFIRDYQEGVVKLANEKGHMVAQIKQNGKYGSKIPIKEEYYTEGPNSLDMQNAIQLQAIQEALIAISDQIQIIDENVKEVLTGQQNDRLGLYYSGVALFIEAYNVKDEEFKKQLIAQSVKALSDSIFQMTLALQVDIAYLARKEYVRNKKSQYEKTHFCDDQTRCRSLSLHGTDHYLNRKSRISDHSSKNAPPYDLRHQQILCGTQSASFFQESVSFYDLRSGGRHGT